MFAESMKPIQAYLMAYPFVLLASFYATWIAGRLTLGHWPRPSLDDPKSIGGLVGVPYGLTVVLLSLGLFVFAFLVIATICEAMMSEDRDLRKRALTVSLKAVIFMVAVIGLSLLDPFGVSAWFMD